MDDLFAFATVRQLAKLQYWATRALNFGHQDAVQRAQMLVAEFAEDIKIGRGVEQRWHERIGGELEPLERALPVNDRNN